jgi:hypothetical protein
VSQERKQHEASTMVPQHLTCSGPAINKIMAIILVNCNIIIRILLVHDTSKYTVTLNLTSGASESLIRLNIFISTHKYSEASLFNPKFN